MERPVPASGTGRTAPGREERFAGLVRRHQAGLWRYLRFLGCEPGLAEDLVQEAFLAAWKGDFEYRGEAAAATWLRRVARNLFVDRVRRARVRPAFRNLDEADRVFARHAEEDGGEAYLQALRECVATLSRKVRRVLARFYGRGRGREQLARELGMTRNGVKTLLRRAREKLRLCVEERVR